jgi:hypothetical protein
MLPLPSFQNSGPVAGNSSSADSLVSEEHALLENNSLLRSH